VRVEVVATTRRTTALLVALFTLAWSILAPYSVLTLRPAHEVYAIWPSANLSMRGASCLWGGPLYVGVPRNPEGPQGFYTVIATPLTSVMVEGFRASGLCRGDGYAAVPGSYHGSPALLIVGPLGPERIIRVSGLVWGSASVAACSGGLVAAAGSTNRGLVVLVANVSGGGVVIRLGKLHDEPRGVGVWEGRVYVLLSSGRVVEADPSGSGARLLEPRLPAGLEARWRGLAAGPRGVWLYGSVRYGNESWAALAPLAGGVGWMLRSRGHGGSVLAAYWDGSRWLLYYRPGSYWDSILSSTPSGGFSGVRLLWTGEHVVSYVSPAPGGWFDTGTVVWRGGAHAVVACLHGPVEADYWLGEKSVMHASVIPKPEAIEAANLTLAPPAARQLETSLTRLDSARPQASPYPAFREPPREARARWMGPLYAATWADLGIVFFAAAWRGFVGGSSEAHRL
jgi:hypothetical protein